MGHWRPKDFRDSGSPHVGHRVHGGEGPGHMTNLASHHRALKSFNTSTNQLRCPLLVQVPLVRVLEYIGKSLRGRDCR